MRVVALHQNENVASLGAHGRFEGSGGRSTRSTESPSEDGNLRGVEDKSNSLHNSGRGGDPQLSVEGLDLTTDPYGTVGQVDGSISAGEGSIPFTLDVTLVDLGCNK